jgi:hypothetical protein
MFRWNFKKSEKITVKRSLIRPVVLMLDARENSDRDIYASFQLNCLYCDLAVDCSVALTAETPRRAFSVNAGPDRI